MAAIKWPNSLPRKKFLIIFLPSDRSRDKSQDELKTVVYCLERSSGPSLDFHTAGRRVELSAHDQYVARGDSERRS